MVMFGEDESAGTPDEAGAGTETDNDGDARTFEKGSANSTLGDGGLLTKTKTVAVVEEEAAYSTQTKRLEACSCPPVARTQEVATQKGTAGEDH